MKVARYLGANVGDLLASPPFSGWEVTRSPQHDWPTNVIWYIFEGHGVEVMCDEAERIGAIILRRGDGKALSEIAFSMSRRDVLEHFGSPSKSGPGVRDPQPTGPWDCFYVRATSIYVEYQRDRDEIDQITLTGGQAVEAPRS